MPLIFSINFDNVPPRFKFMIHIKFISALRKRHGVKVGPGPQDLGTAGPETRDLPQSLKVGPQHLLQSLKVGRS